jgi:hypothetical protein
VACAIAFSVSRPFRKPIHSNPLYLLSIVLIIILNLLFVFIEPSDIDEQGTNGDSWIVNFFLLEPFTLNGESYYSYRWFVFANIVINTAMTITFEKVIITLVTKAWDSRTKTN